MSHAATAARAGRTSGWLLIGCAVALVGYIVIAVTIGADFERDLQAAADRAGIGVNEVATETQAQISHDHALYAALTAVFLFVPPLLLVLALLRIRWAGGTMGALARWTGLAAAVVWWAYVGLGLGLFADPDDLPPVVRDFGPLTVPLVTTLSLLALASVVLASESTRRAGLVGRAGRVASVVGLAIGVLSVVGLVTSDFADPVPPIVIVPSALILGIALVRTTPT